MIITGRNPFFFGSSRTLLDFKSLWRKPLLWIYSSALQISWNVPTIDVLLSSFCLIPLWRVRLSSPQPWNWRTKQYGSCSVHTPKRKGSPAWSPRLCNISASWSTSSLHLSLSLEVSFRLFTSLTTAVIFRYRARKHCPNVLHPTGSWEILKINERSISRTDLEVLLGCFLSWRLVMNLIVGSRVLLNIFRLCAEMSGLLCFARAIIFWPLLKPWCSLLEFRMLCLLYWDLFVWTSLIVNKTNFFLFYCTSSLIF